MYVNSTAPTVLYTVRSAIVIYKFLVLRCVLNSVYFMYMAIFLSVYIEAPYSLSPMSD